MTITWHDRFTNDHVIQMTVFRRQSRRFVWLTNWFPAVSWSSWEIFNPIGNLDQTAAEDTTATGKMFCNMDNWWLNLLMLMIGVYLVLCMRLFQMPRNAKHRKPADDEWAKQFIRNFRYSISPWSARVLDDGTTDIEDTKRASLPSHGQKLGRTSINGNFQPVIWKY